MPACISPGHTHNLTSNDVPHPHAASLCGLSTITKACVRAPLMHFVFGHQPEGEAKGHLERKTCAKGAPYGTQAPAERSMSSSKSTVAPVQQGAAVLEIIQGPGRDLGTSARAASMARVAHTQTPEQPSPLACGTL